MAQHRITSPGEKELVQQTTPEAYGISIPQTRWVVENTWFSCYFDGWIDFVQKSPAKDAFFMGFFMAIEFSLLVFCTMGWSLDWSDHIRRSITGGTPMTPETSMTGIDDRIHLVHPCDASFHHGTNPIWLRELFYLLATPRITRMGCVLSKWVSRCKQSFCSCNGWAGICMCVVELPAWVYQPLQAKKTSTSVCTFPFLLAYHIVSVLFKTLPLLASLIRFTSKVVFFFWN